MSAMLLYFETSENFTFLGTPGGSGTVVPVSRYWNIEIRTPTDIVIINNRQRQPLPPQTGGLYGRI